MNLRMIIAVVMLIFWVAIAYVEYQRGATKLAATFLLMGIVLTIVRYRVARKAASDRSREP